MKKLTNYQCSFCGKIFSLYEECLQHELSEIGMAEEDYCKYSDLKEAVRTASYRMACSHNEDTCEAFDEAIENLMAFEENHEINKEKIKKIGLKY